MLRGEFDRGGGVLAKRIGHAFISDCWTGKNNKLRQIPHHAAPFINITFNNHFTKLMAKRKSHFFVSKQAVKKLVKKLQITSKLGRNREKSDPHLK